MPEVFFDIRKMTSVLGDVIADSAEQRASLLAQRPAYAAHTAGRDFGAHGERIAGLLSQIHSRGLQRVETLGATAESAVRQFAVADDTDDGSARRLGALDPEAAVHAPADKGSRR